MTLPLINDSNYDKTKTPLKSTNSETVDRCLQTNLQIFHFTTDWLWGYNLSELMDRLTVIGRFNPVISLPKGSNSVVDIAENSDECKARVQLLLSAYQCTIELINLTSGLNVFFFLFIVYVIGIFN